MLSAPDLAVVVGRDKQGACVDWYTITDTFTLLANHVAFATAARVTVWANLPAEHLPAIHAGWEAVKAGEPVKATHLLDIAGVWTGRLALTPIAEVQA